MYNNNKKDFVIAIVLNISHDEGYIAQYIFWRAADTI